MRQEPPKPAKVIRTAANTRQAESQGIAAVHLAAAVIAASGVRYTAVDAVALCREVLAEIRK